jgi:hypothetical protein
MFAIRVSMNRNTLPEASVSRSIICKKIWKGCRRIEPCWSIAQAVIALLSQPAYCKGTDFNASAKSLEASRGGKLRSSRSNLHKLCHKKYQVGGMNYDASSNKMLLI